MAGEAVAVGEQAVTFTVKELLTRMDVKLDHVTEKLDKKAEVADLNLIATRLELIERKGSIHAQEAVRDVNKWENRIIQIEKDMASAAAVTQNSEKLKSQDLKIKLAIVATALGFIGQLVFFVLQAMKGKL